MIQTTIPFYSGFQTVMHFPEEKLYKMTKSGEFDPETRQQKVYSMYQFEFIQDKSTPSFHSEFYIMAPLTIINYFIGIEDIKPKIMWLLLSFCAEAKIVELKMLQHHNVCIFKAFKIDWLESIQHFCEKKAFE